MALHGYASTMNVCNSQAEVDAVIRNIRTKNKDPLSVTDWRDPNDPERFRFPCLVQVTYLEHHHS
jgi:hypothetical protein